MRKNLLLLALLVNVAAVSMFVVAESGSPAPSAGAEDVSAIINQLMDRVSRTAETLDAEKTLAVLSDDQDAVFYFNAKAYRKDELVKALGKIFGTLQSMTIRMNKGAVKVLGPDTAMWTATGAGRSVGKSGEIYEEQLTETWIWRKTAGQWRVVHYHESAELAVPKPAQQGK